MSEQKRKIIVVSHCYFNQGVKLTGECAEDVKLERQKKNEFIKKKWEEEVDFIQLPCPEFILYGSRRWGHAASQFDTPFYKKEARKMLEPIILQLKEYQSQPERYELLGVAGIDGSPSCGVSMTFDGNWGGELSSDPKLEDKIASLQKVDRPGIFMEVFMEEAKKEGIELHFFSI